MRSDQIAVSSHQDEHQWHQLQTPAASQQHFIRDREARETRFDAVRHVFHHQAARLLGGTANVRSDHNVPQLQQWVIPGKGNETPSWPLAEHSPVLSSPEGSQGNI